MLIPLALTSNQFAVRRLGGRRWQELHRNIYPAGILGCLHYFWLSKPEALLWPLAYAGYALIRGAATGFWPYPFLDAATLGLPRLALNITVLVALFWTLGLVLVWIASIHRRLIAA